MNPRMRRLHELCEFLLEGGEPSRDDLAFLLSRASFEELELVRLAADEARRRRCGTSVFVAWMLPERWDAPMAGVLGEARDASVSYLFLPSFPSHDLSFSERGSLQLIPRIEGKGDSPDLLDRFKEAGVGAVLVPFVTSSPLLLAHHEARLAFYDYVAMFEAVWKAQMKAWATLSFGLVGQDAWDLADDFLFLRSYDPAGILLTGEGEAGKRMLLLSLLRLVFPASRIAWLPSSVVSSGEMAETLRCGADVLCCILEVEEGLDCVPLIREGGRGRLCGILHSLGRRIVAV